MTSNGNAAIKLKSEIEPESVTHWRDDQPSGTLTLDTWLSVDSPEPFTLRYGYDDWQDIRELESQPLASGWHAVELDLRRIPLIQSLEFTRRFLGARGWERRDWTIWLCSAAGEDGLP